MRRVNYKVKKADGTEFHATSYREATNGGNRIKETYLTEIREENPKVKEWKLRHAQRIGKGSL